TAGGAALLLVQRGVAVAVGCLSHVSSLLSFGDGTTLRAAPRALNGENRDGHGRRRRRVNGLGRHRQRPRPPMRVAASTIFTPHVLVFIHSSRAVAEPRPVGSVKTAGLRSVPRAITHSVAGS